MFQRLIYLISGPSLRLEPDHETLQLARRVVNVVQGTKGMNNNNHIHSNQSNRVSAQGKASSTVSNARPVRNAPPRPSNPAPKIPTGPHGNSLRPVTASSGLNRNPSMRSAPGPPAGPPPPNQPVVRPPLQANNPAGGFRLPNPGAFRLPSLAPGRKHTTNILQTRG